MNTTCNKCSAHGLSFYSEHIQPPDYIEGRKSADIWIIGLNPKGNLGHVEQRTINDFENFDPDCHSYFRDFKKVSPMLYKNWKSQNSRVAHTDLVKCFSQSFPPKTIANATSKAVMIDSIIQNCKTHLLKQLDAGRPKIIICNGSEVCTEMLNLFPPQTSEKLSMLTSYNTTITFNDDSKHSFWIVLSGFIGRIDDRNKRRLGKEIEQIIQIEKIQL